MTTNDQPGTQDVQTISLTALDEEGIILEAPRELSKRGTALEQLLFCRVEVRFNDEAERLREKTKKTRHSVPLSERYILLSTSPGLRDILSELTKDWSYPNLPDDDFLLKRVTLFKIYQALPTSPVGDPSIYEAFSDFLAEEFEGLEERLSSQVDQGYITFNLLPFLFDPQETIIVTYLSGETWYGSRLRSCRAEIQKNETVLEIESEVFCYDGNHLGRHTRYHQIQNFEGTKRLIDLGTFPLKCHPDKELLENTLLSHGRTYLSLVRQRSCMLHSGCAYSISSESISTLSHNGPVLLGNTDLFHRETGLVPRPTAHLVDLVDDHWREKVTFRDTLECLPFVLAYICFNGKEYTVLVKDLKEMKWGTQSLTGLSEDSSRVMDNVIKGMRQGPDTQAIISLIGTMTDNVTIETMREKRRLSDFAVRTATILGVPLLQWSGQGDKPSTRLLHVLRAASSGSAVVLLRCVEFAVDLTNSGHMIIDAIQNHRGLIFISMETPSRMDPLLLQLVDHSLEVHGNTIKLAGEEVIDALSNRPKSEAATPTEAMTPLALRMLRWLFLSDDSPTADKVKEEATRRKELVSGSAPLNVN